MRRPDGYYRLQVVGRVLLVTFVPLVTLIKHLHRGVAEEDEAAHQLGEKLVNVSSFHPVRPQNAPQDMRKNRAKANQSQ